MASSILYTIILYYIGLSSFDASRFSLILYDSSGSFRSVIHFTRWASQRRRASRRRRWLIESIWYDCSQCLCWIDWIVLYPVQVHIEQYDIQYIIYESLYKNIYIHIFAIVITIIYYIILYYFELSSFDAIRFSLILYDSSGSFRSMIHFTCFDPINQICASQRRRASCRRRWLIESNWTTASNVLVGSIESFYIRYRFTLNKLISGL